MQAQTSLQARARVSTICRASVPRCQSRVVRMGGARPQRVEQLDRFTCSAAAVDAVESDAPLGPSPANKTFYPKLMDTAKVKKNWYIIDAEGQTLGRLACLAVNHVRGKLNPAYSPSMDMGDFVIIINAEKVVVTGNKYNAKKYFRHTTGRPGKYKIEAFKDLQERIPERIIEKAVKGMLPKGRLGRRLFHNVKVFKGPDHPHEAQQPVDVTAMLQKKNGNRTVSS
ncbi:hypothetical protein BSKO_06465 [Bryopsis sp. KO-2023]|nr:hypothetical protein BSKO_06465 [Bryopsis sp. KO-2023]